VRSWDERDKEWFGRELGEREEGKRGSGEVRGGLLKWRRLLGTQQKSAQSVGGADLLLVDISLLEAVVCLLPTKTSVPQLRVPSPSDSIFKR
jgi:hypothetical protein